MESDIGKNIILRLFRAGYCVSLSLAGYSHQASGRLLLAALAPVPTGTFPVTGAPALAIAALDIHASTREPPVVGNMATNQEYEYKCSIYCTDWPR